MLEPVIAVPLRFQVAFTPVTVLRQRMSMLPSLLKSEPEGDRTCRVAVSVVLLKAVVVPPTLAFAKEPLLPVDRSQARKVRASVRVPANPALGWK